MKPTLDRRAALDGGRGLHALIVGVSHYPDLPDATAPPDPTGQPPTFGMRRLTRAAYSAHLVARWLEQRAPNELPVPLASCWLLLAPSPDEETLLTAEASQYHPATLENFREALSAWRDAAAVRSDDYAVFYFAGHGVQRSGFDQALLFPGFGMPKRAPLLYAAEVNEILSEMAPSAEYPNIARLQLFLFDACRLEPAAFAQFGPHKVRASGLLEGVTPARDDRNKAIFHATGAGAAAYSIPDLQTAFSMALIDCLAGGAAMADKRFLNEVQKPRWCVTPISLKKGLDEHLRIIRNNYNISQSIEFNQLSEDVVLRWFPNPPDVDVCLRIVPPASHPYARIELRDDEGAIVRSYPEPQTRDPLEERLPAGCYMVDALVNPPTPPFVNVRKTRKFDPPGDDWSIFLT